MRTEPPLFLEKTLRFISEPLWQRRAERMGKRLLIADDEAGILELLKRYFEMAGYEVYTARDGGEVLEKAACRPDLILLDINMPGTDGLEICRLIRDHVSCPILFLTARIEISDKLAGFTAGGDDYIVKPFDLDELGARVAAPHGRPVRPNRRV